MRYRWNMVFKMELLMHRRGSETPLEKPALRGGRAGTGMPRRQGVVQWGGQPLSGLKNLPCASQTPTQPLLHDALLQAPPKCVTHPFVT